MRVFPCGEAWSAVLPFRLEAARNNGFFNLNALFDETLGKGKKAKNKKRIIPLPTSSRVEKCKNKRISLHLQRFGSNPGQNFTIPD
ncbi:hypothetical protein [Aneurinibacillus terranovensis]|uniref:hypothetical protein n=1 Tax=Aneurinibacillus terranovensis TaxID=278991 RepID=UPI000488B43E